MFKLKATNAVQLQGIGYAHALPAAELAIGDETVWNFGSRATVESIKPASAQFVEISLASDRGSFARRFKKSRMVGVTRETYLRHRPDDTSRKVQFAVPGVAVDVSMPAAPLDEKNLSRVPASGIYSE